MDDLQQIKKLAGITPANSANMQPYDPTGGSNISLTGMEKADYQKEKDIRPGTEEWFRLWFALPLMTGEKPY
jgi:hypothetical protein